MPLGMLLVFQVSWSGHPLLVVCAGLQGSWAEPNSADCLPHMHPPYLQAHRGWKVGGES